MFDAPGIQDSSSVKEIIDTPLCLPFVVPCNDACCHTVLPVFSHQFAVFLLAEHGWQAISFFRHVSRILCFGY